MTNLLNIARKDFMDDPFYRYKMNPLSIKYETNFTFVQNINQVSDDLKRNKKSIIKYFGLILGTQSKYDKKRECCSLQGNFNKEKLQNILQDYIDIFVLCSKCNQPDTKIEVNKKKELYLSCDGCGNHYIIKTKKSIINTFIK